MNGKRITGLLFVALGLVILTLKLSHVYDPVPAITKLSVKAGPSIAHFVKTTGPEMVVYIVLVGLPIALGALFLAASAKPQIAAGQPRATAEKPDKTTQAPLPVPVRAPRGRSARNISSCNVLQVGPQSRQIWQFDARNGGFALNREQTSLTGETLPAGLAKDWRSLWQKKLNIAWLPADQVFLRVAQFPASEFNETLSMVELQLEKLSPIPVAQIVWSIQVLPHSGGNMQTVIVIIVARDVVEQFLGELEGQGYLADTLELPILDQLQATPVNSDGVWIYPEAIGGPNAALAAWWYGGVLQNLDMLNLPPTNRSAGVKEQLTQMAWAGELEGWLTSPPRCHLVASGGTAAEWEPILRSGLDQPMEVIEPLPPPRLAAATAERAAATPPNANLLPAEFSTRYHQQFVDRLWMRGLLALCGLYLAGVAVYMVALGVANIRTGKVEQQVAERANSYTNAIQLDARYKILKERQDLKFAALECWKAVAEHMPEALTLENCNFNDGKRFTISGTVSNDEMTKVSDFEAALKKHTLDGQPLFDIFGSETATLRRINPTTTSWSLNLILKRSEAR